VNAGAARSEIAAVVTATPYAWPFHGALTPARTALVACCDSSWRPAAAGVADANLISLAEALSALGGLVVAVVATPARQGRLTRFAEASTLNGLAPSAGSGQSQSASIFAASGIQTLTVSATGTSAFHGSPLDDLLRAHGRTDLLLAGWGLEGPVHSTMRSANDRGYECLLVGDASIAHDPALTFAALDMVRHSGGIFGAYANAQDVTDALSQIPTPVEAS
jgi:nicotinamidase-related amidase